MMWEMAVFIGFSLALVAGCLVPNQWLPSRLPNDKLMHFGAYAGLALLAVRIAPPASAALWLAGLLLAGWLIECLQQLVPGRGFSWRDMAANAAGVAAGALCAAAFASI
jgi:VanZ family protein